MHRDISELISCVWLEGGGMVFAAVKFRNNQTWLQRSRYLVAVNIMYAVNKIMHRDISELIRHKQDACRCTRHFLFISKGTNYSNELCIDINKHINTYYIDYLWLRYYLILPLRAVCYLYLLVHWVLSRYIAFSWFRRIN